MKFLKQIQRRHNSALGDLAALNEAEEHYGEKPSGYWTLHGIRFYLVQFLKCRSPRML
jgi:hypothetical protein